MNKNIWLTAGLAGMLLGNPTADTRAEISVQISTGSRPSFVINSAPSFVYLRTQGFSVSVGSPYDIIYYRNYYYIINNGNWYRSSNYHGPWMVILNKRLPYQIRRHRFEDIRKYRDVEARRSDHENNRYQRNDDNRRRLLDQRNEPHNKNGEAQQKSDANTRRVHDQQTRDTNFRRVEDQQTRNVHNQKVEEKSKKNAKSNDNQKNSGKRD